jgi:hypothetical protein
MSYTSITISFPPMFMLVNEYLGGDWYYDATTNQLRQDNYHHCDAIQQGMFTFYITLSLLLLKDVFLPQTHYVLQFSPMETCTTVSTFL